MAEITAGLNWTEGVAAGPWRQKFSAHVFWNWQAAGRYIGESVKQARASEDSVVLASALNNMGMIHEGIAFENSTQLPNHSLAIE